jgi:hypothetical protein
MKQLKTKLAILALAASGFAAQAQESDLEQQVDAAMAVSQPLAGVIVTGHSNPLLRSDQRLAMLKASLPLGATSTAVQPTDLQRVVGVFPRQPDAAIGEARRMMERGQTPPTGSDPDGNIAVGTW